jgi:hypothetical protein
MLLNMPKILSTTAAWRISIWTSLAFAAGTALVFSILYVVVAKGIRACGDAWLSGEAGVLAQVVHFACGWEELLQPEIERQQKLDKEVVLRADAAFAKPEITMPWKSGA